MPLLLRIAFLVAAVAVAVGGNGGGGSGQDSTATSSSSSSRPPDASEGSRGLVRDASEALEV